MIKQMPYEGLEMYGVSDKGEIINLKTGTVRKTKEVNSGYELVTLKRNDGTMKSVLVHRAVALAFIPNPENKPQVNHKDHNKFNNCVENLEWATQSENMR